MIEATSCGGVVIYRGKILTLYKSYKHKYEGWVLPKGTVEKGEDYKTTALREVKEEAGVAANIIKYIGKSQYSFCIPEDTVEKNVYWYLMSANSYYSRPQRTADRRGRNTLWIPAFTSSTRHIICCAFPMKNRYWKELTANTWI